MRAALQLLQNERERHPDVGLALLLKIFRGRRELKISREHPGHRIENVVQPDLPSGNVPVGAEPLLPNPVAQNRYAVSSWPVLFRKEIAPKRETDSEYRKEIRGNACTEQSCRVP